MKIEARVLILQPRRAVWGVLMRTASWKAWYGRDLLRVEPEWSPSSAMSWAEGDRTTISDCATSERLAFDDRWFELHEATDRTTVAAYGRTLDADLSDDERVTEQQRIEAVALALKKYVEGSGFLPSARRLVLRMIGRRQSRR